MPPTTFKISAHKAEKFSFPRPALEPQKEIEKYLGESDNVEIIQTAKLPSDCKIVMQDNGFVRAILAAYNQHHNLIIRPDDVWAAIMIQFSYYINKHSEEFRSKFVNFEGTKNLAVELYGTLRTVNYSVFIQAISNEIDKNIVDPNFKNWVMPNFSTTTDNDRVVTGAVLMATMKNYFGYFCHTCCGIPSVTLEGTVEDWENLYGRLEKLREYKLENWLALLEPVLQQFLDAKRGKVDTHFWQTVCHYQQNFSGPTYLSGWITTFCVFNSWGNWQAGKYSSLLAIHLHKKRCIGSA